MVVPLTERRKGDNPMNETAERVEKAGAFAVVLECIPAKLAELITKSINIPTIGIGAGAGCDGQILVYHDMLGMFGDFKPKFVKQFARVGAEMEKGIKAYIEENGSGTINQELTLEEYVNYELSRLPEDATEEEKAEAKKYAQIAFSRMDLNQDKKADWKEIAATIATFDTDSDGKQDGKITFNEMLKWSQNLSDSTKSSFSDTLIRNYKKLFGSDE